MISEYLEKFRKAHNLSQKEMALMIGTSPYYYNRIENGITDPGIKMRRKIAMALRIDEETIVKIADVKGEEELNALYKQIESTRSNN